MREAKSASCACHQRLLPSALKHRDPTHEVFEGPATQRRDQVVKLAETGLIMWCKTFVNVERKMMLPVLRQAVTRHDLISEVVTIGGLFSAPCDLK